MGKKKSLRMPAQERMMMEKIHAAATEHAGFTPNRILVIVEGEEIGGGDRAIRRSIWTDRQDEGTVETIAYLHTVMDEQDEEWLAAMVLLAEMEAQSEHEPEKNEGQ